MDNLSLTDSENLGSLSAGFTVCQKLQTTKMNFEKLLG